jgi:hypothetical protein
MTTVSGLPSDDADRDIRSDAITSEKGSKGPQNVAAFGGAASTNIAVGTLYSSTYISSKIGWREVDSRLIEIAKSRAYVPPTPLDQFRKAETALDTSALVILENELGTGKRTDAIRLLAESGSRRDALRIYELLPDWENGPAASILPREPDCRYLLDLTNEGDELPAHFAQDLVEYASSLKDKGSYLVVTVTARVWRRCRDRLENLTVSLPARNPESIVKAHLANDDDLNGFSLLQSESVQKFVAELASSGASPEYAVRVAETLHGATYGTIEQTVLALRKWKPDIQDQLDSRQHGWADRRILLIAAAFLDGADSVVVAAAARRLAQRLGQDRVPLYLALESEGWSTRLRQIGASVINDCTWLSVDRPGVDLAIAEWLWNEQPELRQPVLEWVASLASDKSSKSCSERLVYVIEHITTECRSEELVEKLYSWLWQGNRSDLRLFAQHTLSRLLVNLSIGALVQERLWRWSYSGSTKAIPALAELCSGQFGIEYPSVALARMRHLLTRADSDASRAAINTALRTLARNDSVRPLIVRRVIEWYQDKPTRNSGLVGIIALLDPLPSDSIVPILVEDAAVSREFCDAITRAWDLLLESNESSHITQITQGWSNLRDRDLLHSETIARIWQPAISGLLAGKPWQAFFEAMTEQTKAVALTALSRSFATADDIRPAQMDLLLDRDPVSPPEDSKSFDISGRIFGLPDRAPVGRPTLLADEARLLSTRRFIDLPLQWAHVKAVAAKAEWVAEILDEPDRDVLIAAAWLHDIGCTADAMSTGFPPLDGARWLKSYGFDGRVAALVAHHSCALIDAQERGLDDHLSTEFEREESTIADMLWYCDMTTGPDGQDLSVDQRLELIRSGYGQDHDMRHFLQRAQPKIVESIMRIESLLASKGRDRAK